MWSFVSVYLLSFNIHRNQEMHSGCYLRAILSSKTLAIVKVAALWRMASSTASNVANSNQTISRLRIHPFSKQPFIARDTRYLISANISTRSCFYLVTKYCSLISALESTINFALRWISQAAPQLIRRDRKGCRITARALLPSPLLPSPGVLLYHWLLIHGQLESKINHRSARWSIVSLVEIQTAASRTSSPLLLLLKQLMRDKRAFNLDMNTRQRNWHSRLTTEYNRQD